MASRGLVVIPAFNEEETLPLLLKDLKACDYPLDIVVIDDGSHDRTSEVVTAQGVSVLRHEINRGYREALRTGMRHALSTDAGFIIFLDADGQHRPKYIADLLERASQPDEPDLVIGSRFVEPRTYHGPLGRRAGMRFFSILTGLISGTRVWDTTSGMKLIKRRALEILANENFNDFHAEVIIYCLAAKLRVSEVPIIVMERRSGSSMYNWSAAITYPAKTLLKAMALYPKARRARFR